MVFEKENEGDLGGEENQPSDLADDMYVCMKRRHKENWGKEEAAWLSGACLEREWPGEKVQVGMIERRRSNRRQRLKYV